MSDKIACKNCTYCKFNWKDPLAWFSKYAYICTNPKCDEEHNRIFNPITGSEKLVINEFSTCVSQRSGYGKCGEEALLWKPKHTKDIFTYIKKI